MDTPIYFNIMIHIELLKISQDQTNINVSVSTNVGDTITSFKGWKRTTFKDYNQAIDLTSKLSQTSETEVFQISIEDMGVTLFDDIYFFEITSSNIENACQTCPGNTIIGITANFNKYQECLLNKVLNSSLETLNSCDNNIINVFILLENLKIAIQSGYFTEVITILNTLDVLCKSSNCTLCNTIKFPIYYTGLNYWTFDNQIVLS